MLCKNLEFSTSYTVKVIVKYRLEGGCLTLVNKKFFTQFSKNVYPALLVDCYDIHITKKNIKKYYFIIKNKKNILY